ncbi:hypothetical protein [Bacteroides sp. UBA939]|uniref:hypothetical protein n=1 Tax=Bacteroides sp. UBA939 TaxID=1946092 RepID=UPI0025BC85CE|nr:hypothetical protein [Bacteroides sp. UBA939]
MSKVKDVKFTSMGNITLATCFVPKGNPFFADNHLKLSVSARYDIQWGEFLKYCFTGCLHKLFMVNELLAEIEGSGRIEH